MPPFLERDESGPKKRNKFDLGELSKLPYDPGQRPPISSYNPNVQDEVCRAYLQMGPCQLRFHNFCNSKFGQQHISKNVAYCLCCYLFRQEIGEQASGETFTKNGFSNWKKLERLEEHVGGPNSAHNKAVEQGLAFRGYDESDNSSNQGNYLRILRFLADHNEDIKRVTLKNAPRNNMLIARTFNSKRYYISDALFFVLIDESCDASMKEQMAIVLQYVDKNGSVIERFIGLKHNGCAYYIYCFTYQLQLAIVVVAKKHDQVNSFFNVVANVVNVVGASCKRRDILQEKQLLSVWARPKSRDYLKRFGDACWSPHYGTLLHIISLFPHIISVLEIVAKDKSNSSKQRFQAYCLVEFMESFDFDQDILNAIKLVEICKKNLQIMRENGWDSLHSKVSSFCLKHDIDVPNMNDVFLPWLNNRFNGVNMELLLCFACLYPNDAFAAFDKDKLVCLAQFYPNDFSPIELMALKTQLQTYIMDMRSSTEFVGLKGIGDLAKRMVETKKDKVYPLVYLVTLALVLPVSTATVERTFSAMKFVNNELRNWIGDEWINDNLIVYVKKKMYLIVLIMSLLHNIFII
ncbi:TTF-type domain-containing protein [Citrus sinensis]|uniref:TTF-type domain-containing protein n=1 Tax=Citrus sinensis TaxID=2711 RepID=A0ACB8KJ80_CITSI|nr:TTF-type domain-containing protein [Citrus sinensis]